MAPAESFQPAQDIDASRLEEVKATGVGATRLHDHNPHIMDRRVPAGGDISVLWPRPIQPDRAGRPQQSELLFVVHDDVVDGLSLGVLAGYGGGHRLAVGETHTLVVVGLPSILVMRFKRSAVDALVGCGHG